MATTTGGMEAALSPGCEAADVDAVATAGEVAGLADCAAAAAGVAAADAAVAAVAGELALAVWVGGDVGGAAGVDGVVTTEGVGTTSPGTLGALAAGAAAAGAVAGPGVTPSLFRSLMFFDSSATRADASLVCRFLATASSAAAAADLA